MKATVENGMMLPVMEKGMSFVRKVFVITLLHPRADCPLSTDKYIIVNQFSYNCILQEIKHYIQIRCHALTDIGHSAKVTFLAVIGDQCNKIKTDCIGKMYVLLAHMWLLYSILDIFTQAVGFQVNKF